MVEKRKSVSFIQGLIVLSQIGFGIAVPILLCIYGADYLVKRFSIGSWFMIVGILLGVACGLYNACYLLRKAYQKMNGKKGE